MARINSGTGIIMVDDDPNVDILSVNVGEDSELAWRPVQNELWYWDQTATNWKQVPLLANEGLSIDGKTIQLGHAASGTGVSDFTANRYLYTAGFDLGIESTTGNVQIESTTGNITVGATSTGSLIHKGTQNYPTVTKTADYTIVGGEYIINIDGSTSTVSITTPATPTIGDVYYIRALDVTNAVTLTTPASHKIEGVDTYTFSSSEETIEICYTSVNNWTRLNHTVTPFRLLGSSGGIKTNSYTSSISHEGIMSIGADYNSNSKLYIEDLGDGLQRGIYLASNSSQYGVLNQQYGATGKAFRNEILSDTNNEAAFDNRSKLGLTYSHIRDLATEDNGWKNNWFGTNAQVTSGTSTDLFGGFILYGLDANTSTTGTQAGIFGWYWEDLANSYSNFNLGTGGQNGTFTDDHLGIIGNRTVSGISAKGVEINRWLHIGDFTTTNGTITNPDATFTVESIGNSETTLAVAINDSAGLDLFNIRDDGVIEVKTLASLPVTAPSTGAGIVYVTGVGYLKWNPISLLWELF